MIVEVLVTGMIPIESVQINFIPEDCSCYFSAARTLRRSNGWYPYVKLVIESRNGKIVLAGSFGFIAQVGVCAAQQCPSSFY
jgi:hypothetical protein